MEPHGGCPFQATGWKSGRSLGCPVRSPSPNGPARYCCATPAGAGCATATARTPATCKDPGSSILGPACDAIRPRGLTGQAPPGQNLPGKAWHPASAGPISPPDHPLWCSCWPAPCSGSSRTAGITTGARPSFPDAPRRAPAQSEPASQPASDRSPDGTGPRGRRSAAIRAAAANARSGRPQSPRQTTAA